MNAVAVNFNDFGIHEPPLTREDNCVTHGEFESRCRMRQDDPALLAQGDCTLIREDEGLYLDTSEVGGIWLHPDQDDTRRTVYAEAWSD